MSMQQLIDQMKRYDEKYAKFDLAGRKLCANDVISFNQLDVEGKKLLDAITLAFDHFFVMNNSRLNHQCWKEFKAMATTQNYELHEQNVTTAGHSFGIETPKTVFFIDCVF